MARATCLYSHNATHYRVAEVEDGHERLLRVVLHPAQVQVVPDDGHGQGAFDRHEPLFDCALQFRLALHK